VLRIKIIFFFRRLLARAVASGSAADKVSSQRKLQEMDFPRLIGAPNDFRVERRCGAAAPRRSRTGTLREDRCRCCGRPHGHDANAPGWTWRSWRSQHDEHEATLSNCPLPAAHCPLPAAHCPLPRCPLPRCLLPAARCPLPVASLPVAPLPAARCPLLGTVVIWRSQLNVTPPPPVPLR